MKIKICDFGSACFKDDKIKSEDFTLYYKSPEIAFGTDLLDYQSDLWTVGVMYGELLLGRPMFVV